MRRNDRQVTDIDKIQEIISDSKTAHIAMVDEGRPYIVPLNYGFELLSDSSFVFYLHCAHEGKKLDILKRNNSVCIEISQEGEALRADIPCNAGYYYKSFVGNGKAIIVDDVAEKCKALSIMFKHQTDKDVVFEEKHAKAVCVFKIVTHNYTAKCKPKT